MFHLHSPYQPTGDQPRAIKELVSGIRNQRKHQVLLGVTGSGKTFTVSNVISSVQKPTLVLAHNKTLAAQLYQEYRDFFPDNAVGYFVSYYDYYQPEAYIPQTDTYIEKETEVNDLIDKLRLEATTNLLTRKDVIIVASVSCIYNLGSPSEYERNIMKLSVGQSIKRRALFEQLLTLQYTRVDREFARGTFRTRGDTIDIWPAYENKSLRVETEREKIQSMFWIDPVSSLPTPQLITKNQKLTTFVLYPAKHYVTNPSLYKDVFATIKKDLSTRVKILEKSGKTLEAHRLAQRITYDLEMIAEVGYVNGIENYSRYFDGRLPGQPPHTLLDYFNACDPDFLTIIDESHISVPQLRGMYAGDRSRKKTLIDYGFRLPSALDNRPLKFEEFLKRVPQIIYTSATPDKWEMKMARGEKQMADSRKRVADSKGQSFAASHQPPATSSDGVVEQLIRPTGLIDPEIEIRPSEGQIPDLIKEILIRKRKRERVLVTTLTKRTAEDLAEYLSDEKKLKTVIGSRLSVFDYKSASFLSASFKTGKLKTDVLETENRKQITDDWFTSDLPKVAYLHSDIHTLDRQDVLDHLRSGEIDVLIGINLLREGLDLPEVSLVAILDADKEGFLRSKTSLVQTMGRAARHIEGEVILYADEITRSMKEAIDEVGRRRNIQIQYNIVHNIMPAGIQKPIRNKLVEKPKEDIVTAELPKSISSRYRAASLQDLELSSLTIPDRKALIVHLNKEMLAAADRLDFELAAKLRDKVLEIKSL